MADNDEQAAIDKRIRILEDASKVTLSQHGPDRNIQLELETRQLKARRNALAKIAFLPAELLSKIFGYLQEYSDARYRSFAWINVIRVCRHWRETALACTSLWCDISMESKLESVEVLLERSGSNPIDVDLGHAFLPAPFSHLLDRILSQVYRFRSLSVVGDACSKVLQITSAAPHLEALSIVNFANIRPKNPVVPDAIFHGDAPNLRSLALDGYWIDFKSPLLSRLTSLRVDCLRSWYLAPPPDVLLDALQGMATLQKLFLKIPLPEAYSNASKVRVVRLDHLKVLSVHERVGRVADLLHHLALPTSASVDLDLILPSSITLDRRQTVADAVSSALDAAWLSGPLFPSPSSTRPSLQFLAITNYEYEPEVTIEGSFQHVDFDSLILPVGEPKRKSQLLLTAYQNMDAAFPILLTSFPLSDITSISLGAAQFPFCEYIRLSALPSLESIRLRSESIKGFFELFAIVVHGPSSHHIFPSLKNLALNCVKFVPYDHEDPYDDKRTLVFETLLATLEARARSGPRIRRLAINYGVNFSQEHVDILQSVTEVSWDGRVERREADEMEF
ncbi:hypothetical protein BKA70DRAFT_475392 [Coprinopsis sp. MPI-PUGE-AT-0042]|nr:hypothetical protein BKA70DRAFT_475392 [Coprinopsis sp. MPI-PUGE-AT-0042]